MQMPFGPNDPNSLPAMLARMSPGMTPGPVPQQQLTPGFRPPGAGSAPGIMPQQQTPGMGMDPTAMAALMMMGKGGPGENEQQVNKILDGAPAGAQGDPMAQGAAQSADMQSGPFAWFKRTMRGLF